ncbi:MAG TPA: hypothetical protein VFW63_12760 [Acidimicrobiales bacterium]|nr:hypothetical protein [Acidimicrobiales bacterium]
MRPVPFALGTLCAALSVLAIIAGMSARGDDPSARDGEPSPEPPPGVGGTAGPRSDQPSLEAALGAAVAATRAVPHAHVALQVTVTGPTGPVTLRHEATFTDGGRRARAASDLSQAAAAVEAAGQHLDGDWSRPTGVVVDGDVVYTQLGPLADLLGRHPHDWVRARLADVAPSAAQNDALALALDPLGPLDLLGRPATRVEEVVGAPGAGIPPGSVRRLHATLDITGAADGAPASFEARLAAAGLGSLPVDVWLDREGRVRRLQVALDDGALAVAFDVDRLDTPPEVTPPDPADVVAVTPPGGPA